jgi:osmotically-inducible protein OsmY
MTRLLRAPGAVLGGLVLALAATLTLSACAPAVVAVGMGTGAMMAADRRSAGAQVDDQTIEFKVLGLDAAKPDNVHLNGTSYNGVVLLTGEAPTPAVRADIERLTRAIERVRTVQNEMVVGPVTEIGARTNDSYITSKVKGRFVEAGKFPVNHVKVVTERAVVYLMGLVTREEAAAAAQIAATTTDVARVVKVFEYTN